MRLPIAKDGYGIVALSLLPALVGLGLGVWWLFLVGLAMALFVLWFFRDPERTIPRDPESVVSPADGRVIKVEEVEDRRFTMGRAQLVSIFMSLFDVHVNRAPATGRVKKIVYNPGSFVSANLDKASSENEHNALVVETEGGRLFAVCQIAGLVARRIVCNVEEGSRIEKGQRIGMIKFGSRLDVYLPPDTDIVVRVGDRVRAGESVLARWEKER